MYSVWFGNSKIQRWLLPINLIQNSFHAFQTKFRKGYNLPQLLISVILGCYHNKLSVRARDNIRHGVGLSDQFQHHFTPI